MLEGKTKMILMKYCFLLFISIFFYKQSEAVSFNCQQASSNVEKLICNDSNLSKSDDKLAAIYEDLLHIDPNNRNYLRVQQLDWLKNERNICSNVSCLSDAYNNRTAILNKLKASLGKPGALDICQHVADYANRGALNEIEMPEKVSQLPQERLEQIFQEESLFGVNYHWSLDLNRDKINDDILINYQGTANVGTAYLRSGKEGATTSDLDDYDDGFLDLTFLKVGDHFFVLSGNKSLGRLWAIDDSCEFNYICSYEQKKVPEIDLITGKENPVCYNVGSGTITHIKYTSNHSIGKLPREDRFYEMHVNKGLAEVDINNDGVIDNVVSIAYVTGAGRGGGSTYIATTDQTQTGIPRTPLNVLLLERLAERFGQKMDAFVSNGVTYLDIRRDEDRIIYLIKDDEAKEVCVFRNRTINFKK